MVKRRKEDFINYMVSVLQNSMLTGIPQIASAGNAPKKILRALVFIFCVVGFIYQSMVFMNIYWQYRTVIDIQVENPKSTEMPSITFCTNNGIMTDKVCATYPDACAAVESPPEDICDCLPRFCTDGVFTNESLAGQLKLMELSYSKYEDYKPFLVPLEKLILTCHADFKKAGETQEECGLEYYKNIRSPKDDVVVLYACYTIHTRIGLPDAEPDMVQPQATEYFLFDSVPQILNLHVKDPNFQLSIHHTRNVLNPYLYGSSLSKGNKNLFRLKKTVKHLLPPPYETKCKNYITEWEARGGNGPTTEKECIEECQRNSSLKIHGCITDLLRGPTNAKTCEGHRTNEGWLPLSQECISQECRPACEFNPVEYA
ncbi:uncharacterized protein CDAR_528241 [Caerostris darwini]|uniref:Uncharacterized protein n=1 Tax=Caerostris darwini TaxID=1538125 RepID=A0AAV4USL2_9ARAC|nr:uncharacterized protein CDAR_528241 [Caerostris darwini]